MNSPWVAVGHHDKPGSTGHNEGKKVAIFVDGQERVLAGQSVFLGGGPGANRTRDTRFRRAVLYPLSYEASDHECTGAPTRAATTFR